MLDGFVPAQGRSPRWRYSLAQSWADWYSTCRWSSEFYYSAIWLCRPFLDNVRWLIQQLLLDGTVYCRCYSHNMTTTLGELFGRQSHATTMTSAQSSPYSLNCLAIHSFNLSQRHISQSLIGIHLIRNVSPSSFSQQHSVIPVDPSVLVFSSQLQPAAHGGEDGMGELCKRSHSPNHY